MPAHKWRQRELPPLPPGPGRKCECGICRCCKQRPIRNSFYARNRERISRENYYRYTLPRRKLKRDREPDDAELDRIALEKHEN